MTKKREEKEKILKFIKGFNNITIKSICEENGVRADNVYKSSTSVENMQKIKRELKKRIIELLGSDVNE